MEHSEKFPGGELKVTADNGDITFWYDPDEFAEIVNQEFKPYTLRKHPLNVCVFGAASVNISNKKKKRSYGLGRIIGKHGHNLIFGAGSTGVMGQVFKGYESQNPPCRPFGSTTYAIEEVEDAIDSSKINRIITRSMKDRKDLYHMADVVIVADGGFGTMDELFEFLCFKALNDIVGDGVYWNGELILLKSGISDSVVKLLTNICDQKMAVTWKDYISVKTLNELDEYLNPLG